MPTFNNILVPTDFSDNAAAALAVAARLAFDSGASLSVLTVVPGSPVRFAIQEGILESGDDDATVDAKVTADFEKKLAEFVAPLGDRAASVATFHVFGDPVHEIVDFAASHGIDLVVMGRRGRTLADVMMGSVAERVIRHAQCPVMIVRRAHR